MRTGSRQMLPEEASVAVLAAIPDPEQGPIMCSPLILRAYLWGPEGASRSVGALPAFRVGKGLFSGQI